MASLIYGVSNSSRRGLGYSKSYKNHKNLNRKPKALYEQFVSSGIHVRSSEQTHSEGSQKQPQNRYKSSRTKVHAQIPFKYPAIKSPKVPRTSGKKTNKSGPRKWVPKNKIILPAGNSGSSSKPPVIMPGQWTLVTHNERKAYVPGTGT
jgi:hypothetical protein